MNEKIGSPNFSIYKIYNSIKTDVDRRLAEFARLWKKGSDIDVFKELCFCTCTPQNDAHKAWNAVLTLHENGLVESGGHSDVAEVLRARGVRFHRNKAAYIIANRKVFYPDTKNKISAFIKNMYCIEARDTLQNEVAGWGLKEASHFLRNIGKGGGICILDRHIMRQLALCGVINEVPASITDRLYHEIEQKMIAFAEKEAVPPDVLDLVFWYKEKNELFK